MSVVTRFAPSPTGFLHIGGARTALFNYLFAKHHNGKFLLRVEDTDTARSTDEAVEAILNGLKWLGLDHDDDVVYQMSRQARHAEVAYELLKMGKAYHCYCSPAELDAMREQAKAEGKFVGYNGYWRDRDPSEAPADVKPVIRIKADQTGNTTIQDLVQGAVTVASEQLDDMIILRSDGTPTYNLAVVVDDHDMGITHVIRGDDHLNNAFRQSQIYRAMGWEIPQFAHIPLIHGADGAKLSKRHGALAVEAYRDMGYLPEALCNHLLRLGWGHGDDEIISRAQAIEWFGLDHVGRSPSRFDFAKLDSVNGHYLHALSGAQILPYLTHFLGEISPSAQIFLMRGLESLKLRAKTLKDLADNAKFYTLSAPIPLDEKAAKLLYDNGRQRLAALVQVLEAHTDWQEEPIKHALQSWGESQGLKLGDVAAPLRSALTGSTASPSVFEILSILGRDESLARLGAYAA